MEKNINSRNGRERAGIWGELIKPHPRLPLKELDKLPRAPLPLRAQDSVLEEGICQLEEQHMCGAAAVEAGWELQEQPWIPSWITPG